MPLTALGLSAAIKAQLDADFPIASPEDGSVNGDAERQKFCDSLAEAIVPYILANHTIVTTCPAGAGTGQIS